MKHVNHLFVFCLLILSCSLRAQDTRFGIKAGLNLSVINNTINVGAKEKIGPHVGIYLESRLGKIVSFQPELVYSVQGCKTTLRTGEDNGKIALNYLNLALPFRIYAGQEMNGLYFSAGPQMGFLLSAKETYQTTGSSPGMREQDIKSDIHSLDLALGLGIGYQLKQGLNLGIRYNAGLSNTNQNPDLENFRKSAGIGKMANRVIQFSLGYSF